MAYEHPINFNGVNCDIVISIKDVLVDRDSFFFKDNIYRKIIKDGRMRIITNGEDFAVAKGRWIFTRLCTRQGYWFKRDYYYAKENCWLTLKEAKYVLKRESLKYWDYIEEENEE